MILSEKLNLKKQPYLKMIKSSIFYEIEKKDTRMLYIHLFGVLWKGP